MSSIYFDGKEGPVTANPLAQFKSYSYYHVLAVCDSSETAKDLASAKSGIVEMWLHKSNASNDPSAWDSLGQWAPRSFFDVDTSGKPTKTEGKYCILINGSTDASAVITNVKFSTLAAAGATNNDRFTSLAVEGSIEISEPKGISFLDLITRCCVALGKDAAHVTFLLKTFFVGWGDDDQPHTISNIAPLPFVITEATGSFTEAGGQYKIDFVAMDNGVARLPQYDKMLRSPKLKGGTLKETVSALQKQVNEQYQKMYACVYAQVASQEEPLNYNSGDLTKTLRKVDYVIELDDYYATNEYKFNPNFQQNSDTGSCTDAGQVSTGTDFSLESALHNMMKHCPQVLRDSKSGIKTQLPIPGGRNGKNLVLPAGTKIGYKIHTNLKTNRRSADASVPSHVITYRVVPFPVPKDLMNLDDANRDVILDPNTIEFDYMYTGKNIDILDFDMKMNLGLAYLQIATISNTYKEQGSVFPASATVVDVKQLVNSQHRLNSTEPVEIPVFFSSNLELPANRTSSAINNQTGEAYNTTKHSSVEVLDVSMKITGNLTLLKSTIPTPTEVKSADNDVTQWGFVPGFAKVNIRMPSNNDDIGLFSGESSREEGFTQPFWFNGYYYILGIEHVFADGDFVQNLTMIGLPDPVAGQLDKNDRQRDATINSEIVGECYTSGCSEVTTDKKPNDKKTTDAKTKSVTDSAAVQDAAKKQISQLPPKPIDEVVKNTNPDNIVGWKKMDPKVKSDIITACANDKISLSTYAAIASIESGGKPGAVSPTGARGIFQFITGTWNDHMKAHPVTPNTKPADDPRNNSLYNAQAARSYLNYVSKQMGGTTEPTLLYMGHNLGSSIAPIILKEQLNGTHRSLTDVYASRGLNWAKFAKSNGYTLDATVDTIRDQIAHKFAKKIVDLNAEQQTATSDAAAAGTAVAKQQPAAPATEKTPLPQAGEGAKSNSAKCSAEIAAKKKEKAEKKKKDAKSCGEDTEPKKAKPGTKMEVVQVGAAKVLLTPEAAKKQRGY